MGQQPCDAIGADMRMPGMDGAQLLTEVMRRHPRVVRIVLSGQSDQETRLRAAGPTHQFLTKPCTEETLRTTVARACSLRDLLARHPPRGPASGDRRRTLPHPQRRTRGPQLPAAAIGRRDGDA